MISAPRADYRIDLNGLRGLAVALVVAFHLQLKGATGGFIGVDVFFVLSGYLMTQMVWRRLEAGRFHYGEYLARRAARIWPALAVMVVLLLVAGALWLPPFDMQRIAEQGARALVFVSNHYFLAHSGYITHAGDSLWLLHTWSLSVEWQFYMLYPVLLMVLTRWVPPTRRRVVALGGVTVLLIASLVWHVVLARRGAESGFFLLPARAWELLAGALAALVAQERTSIAKWRLGVSYLGMALVLGGALLIAAARVRTVGAGAWLVLPVVGTVMVLLADADNRVLRHGVLQRLGLWSYSIYLWHWPLIIGLRLTDYPQANPLAANAAIALASVALGWASYSLVERPLMQRGSRGLRAIVAPLATLVVAGAAVVVVSGTDGLAFRRPGRADFYAGYWASVNSHYFPEACSNYKKPLPEIKPCRIDKHTPARVLVIGDSHAEHYYAWFAAHSPGSVDFYTAAECPPVRHMRRTQPGYHCAEYAGEAWRKAQAEPYDTVVVAARWATIGLAGAPYCHESAGNCAEPPTVLAKQAVVLDELRTAITATLAKGKAVVLVDSAAESTLRVADRLAREQFWYGKARLNLPVSVLHAQTDWMEPLFKGLESTPGFHRVSLRSRLCNESSCRTFDESLQRPIYSDESHFDPLWIEHQADVFARFMKPS